MNERNRTFLLSLLLFGCGFAGCDTLLNLDDYKPENQPVLVELVDTSSIIGNNALKADGSLSIAIEAKIFSEAASNRRTVIFRTNLGFFQKSNKDTIAVTADNNFVASANLSSVQSGTATVTASILGSKTPYGKKVQFVKAYPDDITIAVDSISIFGNYKSEMILKATLTTVNGGKPSIGTEVTFDVEREQGGASLGDFANNAKSASTDAQGVAKIRYSPGVVTSPGYAKAKATFNIVLKGKDGKDSVITDSSTTRFYIKI